MNKKILYGIVIGIAVVVIIGLSYVYLADAHLGETTTQQNSTPTPTPTMAMDMSDMTAEEHAAMMAGSVSYQGEDGKTALAVLMEKYPDSKMSGEGEMAFVTEINGRAADTSKNEFWKFMVNGEDAQVGAGTYATKSTDTISWEIDTY